MFAGIDLGTSSVKVVLVDDHQQVVDQQSVALSVERPRPEWSEQDPEAWWGATRAAIDGLRARHAAQWSGVRGLGLSGQMHGAVLLGDGDRVLRPAILWNDGRSADQCRQLEERVPDSREITGNLAMPGFTAPKLMWVAEHEPEIFAQVRRVLLPKDYLRLHLSGDHVCDLSDAAGTLWLDVRRRIWSDAMLAGSGMDLSAMPRLVEGSQPSGRVRADMAARLGLEPGVVIAGGGGDNAAGAVGVGVIEGGQAFVSLGTSGVYFVAAESYQPNPARAVHTFCHCLPERWHQMSVILSAASCLSWVSRLTGARDEGALLDEIGAAQRDRGLVFLPYLSGERTPYNDPHARGVFFGLSHSTERGALGRAVLEGVALAFADGQEALLESGTRIDEVAVIGGGSRSALWVRLLASALARPLLRRRSSELGPAYGAARLARLAVTGEDPRDVCVAPELQDFVDPEPQLVAELGETRGRYQRLYRDLRPLFAAPW